MKAQDGAWTNGLPVLLKCQLCTCLLLTSKLVAMPNISGDTFRSCNTTGGTPYISPLRGTITAEQQSTFYTSHSKLGNTFFCCLLQTCFYLSIKPAIIVMLYTALEPHSPFKTVNTSYSWNCPGTSTVQPVSRRRNTLVGQLRLQLRAFGCCGAWHCKM